MMKKIWKALLMCIKKPSRIWKGFCVLLREGPAALMRRAYQMAARENAEAAAHLPPAPDYREWYLRHRISSGEEKKQRKTVFPNQPKISLVLLAEEPGKISLQAQTYTNWEIICEKNIEEALRQATGEYICLARSGDSLAGDAFFCCVEAINEEPEIDAIYTDDDCICADGETHEKPRMKPDYNPDLLCSTNYIGRFLLVKKTLLERSLSTSRIWECESAADYALVLRIAEQAKKIHHIPRVLYHRGAAAVTALMEEKTEAQKQKEAIADQEMLRALQAHYDRQKLPATALPGSVPGIFHTQYHWSEQPLISILIPNKDHVEDLKKCIGSIEERSAYRNYEFIIVENNSTEPATFAFYEQLEKTRDNITVVRYEGGFHYAKINNLGAKYAKGDYLLLLNNDTELIAGDSLQELLGYCMREDVGIVGARLYFPDDTIQHAGVIIGFGSIAGHAFVNTPRGEGGYENRILCAQDYSAVTAACLMVKKTVFQAVGGMTEDFAVAFNDVDFCMKVRALGKLVVYHPYAEFYHYEMKSRGVEDSSTKVARFRREVEAFAARWPEIVEKGDPYYNPNLALDRPDFALAKKIKRR